MSRIPYRAPSRKGSGGSGMTRGDRRRNARRERLRKLLPRDDAGIRIDLAQEKQALAGIDYDVPGVARKKGGAKAVPPGQAPGWAGTTVRVTGGWEGVCGV